MRYSIVATTLLMAVLYPHDSWAQLRGMKYQLPLATLDGKEICGKRSCIPAIRTGGSTFHYVVHPYMINSDVKGGAKGAAARMIGYVRRSDDRSGDTPLRCGTTHPFRMSDITQKLGDGGIATDYRKNGKLDLKVASKVKADIDAMKSLGLPSKTLTVDQARAELTATYNRLQGSKLEYKGTYYVFSLTDDAYRDMKQFGRTSEGEVCYDYLRTPIVTKDGTEIGKELITDVGLVSYSAKFTSSNEATIVSELQSKFASSGVPFDLTASVNRSVEEQLKQELSGAFSAISITSVPASLLGIDTTP